MRREALLWYHCVWPISCFSPGQKWSKCRKVKLNSSHLLFLCLPPCVIDVRVGGGCIFEEKRLQRESLSLGRIGLSSIKWDWSQSDEHRFFSFSLFQIFIRLPAVNISFSAYFFTHPRYISISTSFINRTLIQCYNWRRGLVRDIPLYQVFSFLTLLKTPLTPPLRF